MSGGRFTPALRLGFRLVGLLPERVRGVLSGLGTPAYRLGASCVIVDEGGRWLLVRHSYRSGWSLPGGGSARAEDPRATARREMGEELGIEVEVGASAPVLLARPRRLTFVFVARIAAGEPSVHSPELEEFGWFDPAALPSERDPWLGVAEPVARRLVAGEAVPLIFIDDELPGCDEP